MAQEPSSAQFESMPRSALGTGYVDFSGTPAELARHLITLPDRVRDIPLEATLSNGDEETEVLNRLFVQLRSRTGYDFSDYKRSTISRRMRRRMQVLRVDGLPDYLERVRADGEEAHALVKDFLISVTNFFRDPETYDAFTDHHLPELIAHADRDTPIRVWVAGCATGEEAYSIAMLICEALDPLSHPPTVQIFATDIDDEALAIARMGLYPRAIAGDVSPERLKRFFREEAGGYRVTDELSESVLFAHHNLLKDPPFSRLDLITCRNVLIYFNRRLQERVLATFHYALRRHGRLILGSSETAKTPGSLFETKDGAHRIYAPCRRRVNDLPSASPRSLALSLDSPRLKRSAKASIERAALRHGRDAPTSARAADGSAQRARHARLRSPPLRGRHRALPAARPRRAVAQLAADDLARAARRGAVDPVSGVSRKRGRADRRAPRRRLDDARERERTRSRRRPRPLGRRRVRRPGRTGPGPRSGLQSPTRRRAALARRRPASRPDPAAPALADDSRRVRDLGRRTAREQRGAADR